MIDGISNSEGVANRAYRPRIAQYTAADGYRGFVRIWEVEQPLARVIFLHGIISHGGWYGSSCAHLAKAGFEVHFIERRGSGLNVANRGDVDVWTTWRDDVENYLRSLGSDLPRILLGISWGGKLAAAVAIHGPQLLNGVGLICPGLYAKRGAGRLQRELVRFAAFTPLRNCEVTIPLQDAALFTDSPIWQRFIDRDSLAIRRITLRFARADQKMNEFLVSSVQPISVPFLMMLAGKDRISHNAQLRTFFEKLNAPVKQLIDYPTAAHTLEFEGDSISYLQDLTNWMISCTNTRVATG